MRPQSMLELSFGENKYFLENFEPKIISSPHTKYSKGSIVIHKKFGQGRVESIDGKKLTINFGESGTRKVMENFVESIN